MRFPGQYYDAESQLHYNRFRYYDPEVGRYVSSDPIGQRGGVNVYSYARNLPGWLFDPFGLWTGHAGWTATAGAGGGSSSTASLSVDSNGEVAAGHSS